MARWCRKCYNIGSFPKILRHLNVNEGDFILTWNSGRSYSGMAANSFNKYQPIIFGVFILCGLWLCSLYNYLLFHTLVETFSIAVAVGMFFVVWNTRGFMEANYLLVLGIASFFVAGIDLVHMLAYKGMTVFPGYDANLPTQLWIAGRYLQSISWLLMPLMIGRKFSARTVSMIYLIVTGGLLAAIFSGFFPTCYTEGSGLTAFKKISEYIISLVFISAIFLIWRKRHSFNAKIWNLLIAATVLNIFAELAFTFYVSVFGLSNLFGHIFRLIAFYLIYRAIIQTGLEQPYALLFKQTADSMERMRASEKLLRTMAENYPNSYVSIIEKDFTVGFSAGQGFTKQNLDPEQFRGLTLELIFGEQAGIVRAYYQRTFQGEECSFELFINDQYQLYRTVPLRHGLNQIDQILVVTENITERKKNEKALADSELQYRTLVENSGTSVLVLDKDGVYIIANAWAAANMGGQPEDFVGKSMVDVFPLDEANLYLKENLEVIESGIGRSYERTYELATGSKTFFVIDQVIKDSNGNGVALQSSSIDITERKQAERQLEFQAHLLSQVSDAVIATDHELMITFWNEAASQVYGWEKEDALGRHLDELLKTMFINETQAETQAKLLANGQWEGDLQQQTRDGQTLDIEASVTWLKDAEGEIIGGITSNRDVTRRKKAEQIVSEYDAKMRTTIDSIQDIVFSVDGHYRLQICNEAFEDALLAAGGRIIPLGESVLADEYPDDFNKLWQGYYDTALAGERVMIETSMMWADGLHHFENYLNPNTSIDGAITGVTIFTHDVTRQKQADAIMQARLRLTEFSLSHSLDELFQATLDEAEALTGSTIGFYHLLEADEKTLVLQAWSTNTLENMCKAEGKGQHYDVDQAGVWVDAIHEKKPVIHNDYVALPHRKGMPDGHATVEREMVVPIIRNDKIVAILGIGNKPTSYDKNDVQAISLLADLAWEVVERKRSEEALQVSESRLRASLENSAQVSAQWYDQNGRVVFWNPASEKIYGWSSAEAIGKTVDELMLPGEGSVEFQKIVNTINESGKSYGPVEKQITRRDGSSGTVLSSLFTIPSGDGQPLFVCMDVDITERIRAKANLEQAIQQLHVLRDFNVAILSNLDLRVLLKMFTDEAVCQLQVDAVCILLANPHTNELEYAASQGFYTDWIENTQIHIGNGYAGKAAFENKTIYIPDLSSKSSGPLLSIMIEDEKFIGYYGLPLIAKGQVQGVMEIYKRSPFKRDADWENFVETLAGQAAIAIENATLFEDLRRSKINLEKAYDNTLEGWSRALDLRDRETEGHTQRVSELAVKLAKALLFDQSKLVQLRRGALLHDIGKMGIPDAILHKPGPLTDAELDIMRKHPSYAFEMLSPIEYLHDVIDIPYCHHEKWDGSGYPRGLKGEQIPFAARIFCIVDVWDALTSDRSYRKAWSKIKAFEYIRAQAGKHFDPKVVEVFLNLKLDN